MHLTPSLRTGTARPARLTAAAWLAALGAATLAGCGSSGDTGVQTNGAKTAPAIGLHATLVLTSPFPLTGQFTDDISASAAAATCADAAKGFNQDGTRYQPPHNPQDAKLNGGDGHQHAVTITLHVTGFKGPGAYTKDSIQGDDDFQLLLVDGVSYGVVNGGTVTLTVNADGSGRLQLDKLSLAPPPTPQPTDVPSSSGSPTPTVAPTPTPKPTPTPSLPSIPPLTGTLTWSCVQERATPSASAVSSGSATSPQPSATR